MNRSDCDLRFVRALLFVFEGEPNFGAVLVRHERAHRLAEVFHVAHELHFSFFVQQIRRLEVPQILAGGQRRSKVDCRALGWNLGRLSRQSLLYERIKVGTWVSFV